MKSSPKKTKRPLCPGQPLLDHLRLRRVFSREGAARIEFVVREIHLRRGGILHGGIYAVVLDSVTGYAVQSVTPDGRDFLTLQLNVNMTGVAKLGDRLIATARALHAGRRTVVASGEIRRADGKLLAAGTATLMYLPAAAAAGNTPSTPSAPSRSKKPANAAPSSTAGNG